VDTVLLTHTVFATFVYGFGESSALTKVDMNWLAVPIMGGMGNFATTPNRSILTLLQLSAAFIGQSFYAYRVYVLSKSCLIPLLIGVVSILFFLSLDYSHELAGFSHKQCWRIRDRCLYLRMCDDSSFHRVRVNGSSQVHNIPLVENQKISVAIGVCARE
jgi:hypothetical protein